MAEDESTVGLSAGRVVGGTNQFVYYVEILTAIVFAALFAIGVIDLILAILGAVRTGEITDPLVVIEFIDTGLLLLIIIEVYHTVIAYIEESSTARIVRLVTYTGVIAMVRKVITFRTEAYDGAQEALLAAGAYALVIVALIGLLWVYHRTST